MSRNNHKSVTIPVANQPKEQHGIGFVLAISVVVLISSVILFLIGGVTRDAALWTFLTGIALGVIGIAFAFRLGVINKKIERDNVTRFTTWLDGELREHVESVAEVAVPTSNLRELAAAGTTSFDADRVHYAIELTEKNTVKVYKKKLPSLTSKTSKVGKRASKASPLVRNQIRKSRGAGHVSSGGGYSDPSLIGAVIAATTISTIAGGSSYSDNSGGSSFDGSGGSGGF
jgi:hypothetical protein